MSWITSNENGKAPGNEQFSLALINVVQLSSNRKLPPWSFCKTHPKRFHDKSHNLTLMATVFFLNIALFTYTYDRLACSLVIHSYRNQTFLSQHFNHVKEKKEYWQDLPYTILQLWNTHPEIIDITTLIYKFIMFMLSQKIVM